MFLSKIGFLSRRLTVAAAAAMVVAGTGLHDSDSPVHAAPQAAPSVNRNTLSIGWATETQTLDPVNNAFNPDIWVMVNIYDQLLRVSDNGKSLNADLATSWKITSKGKVYTFHLRPGVHFQNGQRLTASDVKFCLDRARVSTEAWSWSLVAIRKVEAPSASTVRITLKYPWAPFLSDLSLFDAGVYPKAYFEKMGERYMSSHPIGTGPYLFHQWKRGQYLLLQKNHHYWATSKFPMEYIKYELIPNDTTRLLDAEAGALDVDVALPYNLTQQAQANSRDRTRG